MNGQFVGYSQGSMTPHEFDVTRYLLNGENLVCAKVYRYSDGSYLEDQDMWWLCGIYREVYLFAEPKACLRDFYFRTEPDADFRDWTVRLDGYLHLYAPTKEDLTCVPLCIGTAKRFMIWAVLPARGTSPVRPCSWKLRLRHRCCGPQSNQTPIRW
mgnify:CR=1 FL=1